MSSGPRRRNASGGKWWQQFTSAQGAVFGITFCGKFDDNHFHDLAEELLACEHNLKRFGASTNPDEQHWLDCLKTDIARLKMQVDGTWEAYQQKERERTRKQAREVLDFIENDHQRVCRNCFHEFTTKGCFQNCPKCHCPDCVAINPKSESCSSYEKTVEFIKNQQKGSTMNLKKCKDSAGEFFVNDPTPEEQKVWNGFYPPTQGENSIETENNNPTTTSENN